MIWGAAGIGIAVGAGFYREAIAVVCLLIVSVEIIPFMLIKPMKRMKSEHEISITVDNAVHLENVLNHIRKEKIKINHSRIKNIKSDSDNGLEIHAKVTCRRNITDLYQILTSMDGVVSIEISN